MKTNKIIIFFTLFLFINISTFANKNMEILVNKMVNNTTVIQLFKNKIILSYMKGIEIDSQDENQDILKYISSKTDEVKKENIFLKANINKEFPEYMNLSMSEKSEVIEGILNSSVINEHWDCIKRETELFAILMLPNALPPILVYFEKCVFSALLADFFGDAATDGFGTPLVPAAATAEMVACKYLATGILTYDAFVIKEYISSLFKCAGN
ncbi:hypothetical protein [Flavobacterium sp.]|uniref:hypothetical protein n=1 Tax=Flavobacterium sp. TaxID=239 RepID=UPI00286E5A36|nr:hypothetical protein [Flavobacterium sp.]